MMIRRTDAIAREGPHLLPWEGWLKVKMADMLKGGASMSER